MRGAVVVLTLVSACSFDPPPAIVDGSPGGDDADPIDAAPPDAETGCVPNTVRCEDDRYTQCSAEGVVEVALDCPLGCDGSQPKCVDVDPSNGVAEHLDRARTDAAAPELVLGAGSSIDTTTGMVFNGGVSVDVPSTDVGAHRVFIVRSLAITGATTVTGADGLIIVSDGDVAITALLDVSANQRVNGPGGGAGACDGLDSQAASGTGGGAGGAGNGDPGAGGGSGNGGSNAGGGGGPALTDLDLDALRGGCEGGQATQGGSACTSFGGGGGGALQITSRTIITVSGAGVIDASGGGGEPPTIDNVTCFNTSIRGGGGGGSGGNVLLEAPQVVLDGAGVILSTKGGGGSAGGIGGAVYDGEDGGTSATPAAGGVNGVGTNANGGQGGTETLAPGAGVDGDSNENGGGGGGAVGRARFNTSAGTINPINGATIRSKQSSGVLGTRLVP